LPRLLQVPVQTGERFLLHRPSIAENSHKKHKKAQEEGIGPGHNQVFHFFFPFLCLFVFFVAISCRLGQCFGRRRSESGPPTQILQHRNISGAGRGRTRIELLCPDRSESPADRPSA
jgi:hypothetical protein